MAPAARRRERLAPIPAQVAGALVAAVAVPALALAGTATPVTAHPITAASPAVTESSAPGDPTAGPTPSGPTAGPTSTGPTAGPTPTEPPATEPAPTQPPTAEPPSTEPPAGSPPIRATWPPPTRPPGPAPPAIQRPGQQARTKPGQPRLGVFLSTSDVVLTSSYWNRPATFVELRVTVGNTGDVAERVRLRYTLPLGVTDAGTRGCYRAGNRSYECAAWTADSGARWSTRLQLRVAGDAWHGMPLRGSVRVTATAPAHPHAGEVGDDQGFAVLAPDGTATGTDGGLAAGGWAETRTGSDSRNLAITLIGVSMLLVVLALALAVTSLRRRLGEEPAPSAAPAGAPVDGGAPPVGQNRLKWSTIRHWRPRSQV